MSKERIEICKFYVCANHTCEKGRDAEHNGYCQRCDKYETRAHIKHLNKKKEKLNKIKEKEFDI